eukprot:EG_transcript_45965
MRTCRVIADKSKSGTATHPPKSPAHRTDRGSSYRSPRAAPALNGRYTGWAGNWGQPCQYGAGHSARQDAWNRGRGNRQCESEWQRWERGRVPREEMTWTNLTGWQNGHDQTRASERQKQK